MSPRPIFARPCGSWRPQKNETLVACLDHGVVDRLRQRRIVEPWLELLSFAAGREKLNPLSAAGEPANSRSSVSLAEYRLEARNREFESNSLQRGVMYEPALTSCHDLEDGLGRPVR
jgi:hypothetical protein